MLCVLSLVFSSCSPGKAIDIADDFSFDQAGFCKEYDIATFVNYLDIGIQFADETFKENLPKEGSLELTVFFENGKRKKMNSSGITKIVYDDAAKLSVKKIYLTPLELQEYEFIRRITVTVKSPFMTGGKCKLVIDNMDSAFFFEK